MKRLLRTFFFLVCGLCTFSAFSGETTPRVARLDSLLAAHDYEKIMYELFPEYKGAPATLTSASYKEENLSWLKANAPKAEFPLRYFLSWILKDTDLAEARKWNASGRIALMLDIEACKNRRDRGIVWYMIVEGRDSTLMRADDKKWAMAVDEALQWNSEDLLSVGFSKGWFCGNGNLNSAEDAKNGRIDLRQQIKKRNDLTLNKPS